MQGNSSARSHERRGHDHNVHSRRGSTSLVLTLNGGSSSIRFALYDVSEIPRRRIIGKVDRVGLRGTVLKFKEETGEERTDPVILPADSPSAVRILLDWLSERATLNSLGAVGHRIVNGMMLSSPARITPGLLDELKRISPYDPDHLPVEILLIEEILKRCPDLPQVACFDSTFHQTMPRVASILPIPRRYESSGVRRYGFHGLSYEFLVGELSRLGDPAATNGRMILAHLGSGASLAAIRDGKCIDTTMGFTPAGGLVMGTRSGDLDPGLASYLESVEKMSSSAFLEMANHESGLLGISETSSDMRELLNQELQDVRSAEAIALFNYQVKKGIGAYAAALGGLDTLVFSGGIGENAPIVRARICDGLEFLGIEIDEEKNQVGQGVISRSSSRVAVRVIPTDEERMIVETVIRIVEPVRIQRGAE